MDFAGFELDFRGILCEIECWDGASEMARAQLLYNRVMTGENMR